MREKPPITRAPNAFCHIPEPAPQGIAGARHTRDPQDYKALMGELSIYPTLTPSWGFPSGSVEKNSPANASDASLIPGSGRSVGGGNGNPLQYSCLGNAVDREPGRPHSMGSQRAGHDLVTKQQQRLKLLSHQFKKHLHRQSCRTQVPKETESFYTCREVPHPGPHLTTHDP